MTPLNSPTLNNVARHERSTLASSIDASVFAKLDGLDCTVTNYPSKFDIGTPSPNSTIAQALGWERNALAVVRGQPETSAVTTSSRTGHSVLALYKAQTCFAHRHCGSRTRSQVAPSR